VSQARVLALGAAIRAPGQATAPSSVHLIPSGPERP
jgi:hypothetical protein